MLFASVLLLLLLIDCYVWFVWFGALVWLRFIWILLVFCCFCLCVCFVDCVGCGLYLVVGGLCLILNVFWLPWCCLFTLLVWL